VIAAAIAGPALAADKPATHKPLAKMTCEDFIGLDETFQPKAIYWAAAYAKGGKPEAAVLDVDGIESVVPVVVEECRKAPKASFWEKVKAEIKKIEKKM
jgi:acid stress chaperone HdeA